MSTQHWSRAKLSTTFLTKTEKNYVGSEFGEYRANWYKIQVPFFETQDRRFSVEGVPIIGAAGIKDPQECGKSDRIGLGKALFADSPWAEKPKMGGRVRPCIRCNVYQYEAVVKWQEIIRRSTRIRPMRLRNL